MLLSKQSQSPFERRIFGCMRQKLPVPMNYFKGDLQQRRAQSVSGMHLAQAQVSEYRVRVSLLTHTCKTTTESHIKIR